MKEFSRMTGNTASLNFTAFNGYIIKVNEEDDSQVWVQYFYSYGGSEHIEYHEPELRDLEFYFNEDTGEQEAGFEEKDSDDIFFLSEFMRDNYMAGVK